MSDRELVLAIVDRLAAGTATDDDRDQLNAALQRDSGCVELYARAMRQQRLLRVLLAEGASGDTEGVQTQGSRASIRLPRRGAARPRAAARPRGAAGLAPWALAAALLMGVSAFAWMARAPASAGPPSGLVVIAGVGRAAGAPLVVGDAIAAGTAIRAAGGGLELRAGDGSRIALAEGALLELRSDDATAFAADLLAGSARMTVRAQARDRRFAITTPQANATVRGTAFTLSIADGATRIAVREGLVHFERRADGWAIDVAAGEEATTAKPVESGPAAEAVVSAPAGTSWRVNLGGAALVSDGIAWQGHEEALGRGMRCEATLRSEPRVELVLRPAADPGTTALLATGIWDHARTWTLSLPVLPGTYQVRVWEVENHPLNDGRRRFDVAAEGRPLFTDLGGQPLGGWTIHGPARITVHDGTLDLACIAHEAEAHLMAIEVLPVGR